MISECIISWQEDIDEISEMEIDEAEDPLPNIDPMPPVPNIDEGDEGNPLAVAKYIQDMSKFYREKEVNLSSWIYNISWLYRLSSPFVLLIMLLCLLN